MPENNEPLFLTREMVDEIHETAISAYGGLGGVLNEHLLESAINQPRHTYHIGGGDLFEVAAAYAYWATALVVYRETMEVHFAPEQEAQLSQIATHAGTDAEHLVKNAALRLLYEETRFREAVR